MLCGGIQRELEIVFTSKLRVPYTEYWRVYSTAHSLVKDHCEAVVASCKSQKACRPLISLLKPPPHHTAVYPSERNFQV